MCLGTLMFLQLAGLLNEPEGGVLLDADAKGLGANRVIMMARGALAMRGPGADGGGFAGLQALPMYYRSVGMKPGDNPRKSVRDSELIGRRCQCPNGHWQRARE